MFIHPVISVSLYTESPIFKRIWKPKYLKLGMYTRKSPVLLKVQSNEVIESFKDKEIIFKIENLEFSLLSSHKNGKCTFVIRDHITGLARIYQVASFVELCWWFEAFKRLKEKYLERNCTEKEGLVQDFSLAVIPQPKRLSLKSVTSTLVEMEMFESHTTSSLQNLQDLSTQLKELKNSIYRKNQ